MEDENKQPESSTGEGSEGGAKAKPEEQMVPYARFKEVNEKAKQEEALRKETEAKLAKLNEKPEASNTAKRESIAELASILKQYDSDELAQLETFAEQSGRTLREVAENPLVKAGLESIRSKKKSEQATPSPSSRGVAMVGNKTLSQALTEAKSPDEARTAFNEAAEKALQRVRR